MKATVIYHSADFDGIFCREIARKFLPPDTIFIGWNFGDEPLPIPDGPIYVLDLPVDRVFNRVFNNMAANNVVLPQFTREENQRLIWIDHHKSSIETHPESIPGYRIDGVAACRLAWQWFACEGRFDMDAPALEHYVDRRVSEPWAVRLAGEYDIWDKRDPDAELFQHGLRSRQLGPDTWDILLSGPTEQVGDRKGLAELYVATLLDAGQALQYARTQENASIIKELGFTFQWEGLTWLACNHVRYNSLLFTAGIKPEHDACFGFKFTGNAEPGRPSKDWSISLYHAPGKEHHDLSNIAKKYGGGGHKGACGFQTDKLPFLL
jgi:hypothetical protein